MQRDIPKMPHLSVRGKVGVIQTFDCGFTDIIVYGHQYERETCIDYALPLACHEALCLCLFVLLNLLFLAMWMTHSFMIAQRHHAVHSAMTAIGCSLHPGIYYIIYYNMYRGVTVDVNAPNYRTLSVSRKRHMCM